VKYNTPDGYKYVLHLRKHLGDFDGFFKQRGIFPRQLTLYMPGHGKSGCNYNCVYCSGGLSPKTFNKWEQKGIDFIHELDGRIPSIFITGGCTEPTLNSYLLSFLVAIKENGSCCGFKTNGSLLTRLENKQSFLTRVCEISDSPDDFISISLDAGSSKSHSQTKGVSEREFAKVVNGIMLLGNIRGSNKFPALRLSYLLNDINDAKEEIETAIKITKDANFDSIRFSSATPMYGLDKEGTKVVRADEHQRHLRYDKLFEDIISDSHPFIFYAPPYEQNFNMRFCGYGYYQICLSHDGNFYRCTSGAAVEAIGSRLGALTDVADFMGYLQDNQSKEFSPLVCFKNGLYCCRAGTAINNYINSIMDD
jgi:MoaA/NifB/PqqE/SkfB family radical SAM enzyme